MMHTLLERLSPAGGQARLSSLIFHRVLPQQDAIFPNEMHAASFDALIAWLTRWFNVLPMAEALAGLRSGQLPARAAIVTFDDGYADNGEIATPILRRHNCPATFFIAAGFLDGGRMWNDTVIETVRACSAAQLDLRALSLGLYPLANASERRAAIQAIIAKVKYLPQTERARTVEAIVQLAQVSLPKNLMLSSEQLRAMHAAGMTIGAHTMTHPILTRLEDHQARDEMQRSREKLQSILGAPVDFFAYPNGKPGDDYDARHVRMARELGFKAAFSTVWGSARAGADMFQLPRFTPWDRSPVRFALRMAHNLRRDADGLVAA